MKRLTVILVLAGSMIFPTAVSAQSPATGMPWFNQWRQTDDVLLRLWCAINPLIIDDLFGLNAHQRAAACRRLLR